MFAKLMKAAPLRAVYLRCSNPLQSNLFAMFKSVAEEPRGYCNSQCGCNERATQFFVAKVESGNWNCGICTLSCAPPSFDLLRYCRRFVCCTKMRKEVLCCLTVGIGLPGDASDYCKDKMSVVAAHVQNKLVVEWGSCESC